jgi:hypothetical protein
MLQNKFKRCFTKERRNRQKQTKYIIFKVVGQVTERLNDSAYVPVEYTGGEQNNENSKKLWNRFCAGFIERTSIGNSKYYYSVFLHSLVLVSVY